MNLRLKVVLMLVAVVLPMTAGFSTLRLLVERRAQQLQHVERVATRITQRPLRRCAQDPRRFQQRIRRLEVFAYDATFTSLNPNAPPFPDELKRALIELTDRTPQEQEESLELVHQPGSLLSPQGISALKLADQGPCSIALLKWQAPPEPNHGIWRLVISQSLIFLFALLTSGLAITIPLVRRIRRLTLEVQQAPQHHLQIQAERESRDELGDLARAFNDIGAQIQGTIAQLHQRDETLKAYISNTTHDLAIPLTVLQHRLARQREQIKRGELVELEQVDGALQEAHYIGSLIDNMSAAAKLEAGHAHLKLHRFDLVELLGRVATRHEPIAALKHIELNCATPPHPVFINADSTLIEQALNNLTQNAVQYANSPGHVALVLDQIDDRFELQVLDDGPGVSPELLPIITQRHARGDDDVRTRNPKGQGFGLSIVKAICELHDITWSIENMDEGGLRVTLQGELAENMEPVE